MCFNSGGFFLLFFFSPVLSTWHLSGHHGRWARPPCPASPGRTQCRREPSSGATEIWHLQGSFPLSSWNFREADKCLAECQAFMYIHKNQIGDFHTENAPRFGYSFSCNEWLALHLHVLSLSLFHISFPVLFPLTLFKTLLLHTPPTFNLALSNQYRN